MQGTQEAKHTYTHMHQHAPLEREVVSVFQNASYSLESAGLNLQVTSVRKPNIGDTKPALVQVRPLSLFSTAPSTLLSYLFRWVVSACPAHGKFHPFTGGARVMGLVNSCPAHTGEERSVYLNMEARTKVTAAKADTVFRNMG